MAGKISNHVHFWENELHASPFVLGMVKRGYNLPFVRRPASFYARNNQSSLRHSEFVSTAIQELLKDGCIKEVESMPFVCNPLTVAEGEKLRLVLDLRHVNEHF